MASKEIEAKIAEQQELLQQQKVEQSSDTAKAKKELAEELATKNDEVSTEDSKDDKDTEEGSKMETKEEHDAKMAKNTEQSKGLKALLRGVNDTYKHHFNFEELGLEFDLSIKVPNALEEAPITNFVFSQFPDLDAVPNYQYTVFYTIKLIELQGIDVPVFLVDLENIYNTDILYAIGENYFEWRSRFQF